MSAEDKHIWKLRQDHDPTNAEKWSTKMEDPGSTYFGPAPMLVPIDSNIDYTPSDISEVVGKENQKGIAGHTGNWPVKELNVVNDFTWNLSPSRSYEDLPYISMVEKKIYSNPYLDYILERYRAGVPADLQVAEATIAEAVKSIADAAGGVKDTLANAWNNVVTSLSSVGDLPVMLKKLATDLVNKSIRIDEIGGHLLSQGMEGIEGTNPDFQSMNQLNPYKYILRDSNTPWSFRFPYLGEDAKQVMNSWDANTGGTSNRAQGSIGDIGKPLNIGLPKEGLLAAMAGIMTTRRLENTGQIAMNFRKFIHFKEPGFHALTPKGYTHGDRTKSYQIQFPLLNTENWIDVIRNWQLVYMLIYNNLPNRYDKAVERPPVHYEVNIPGVWYSRYAYIERIEVKYAGTTRRMGIPIHYDISGDFDEPPGVDTIDTIIPEIYVVNITVKEMFGETQNTLFSSLRGKEFINKSPNLDTADVHEPSEPDVIPGVNDPLTNQIRDTSELDPYGPERATIPKEPARIKAQEYRTGTKMDNYELDRQLDRENTAEFMKEAGGSQV
jgi:hypothetical protein